MKSIYVRTTVLATILACSPLITPAYAQGGRLLATGGVTEIDGAGGGGIVPWALIAGYGTNDQIGGTAFYTTVVTNNFLLNSVGANVGFYNRVELSYAKQSFSLGSTGSGLGLGLNNNVGQNIFGIKVRLYGNAVYDQNTFMPQISVGMMYKRDTNPILSQALGASSGNGEEYYLALTKLIIGGFFGRDLLVDADVLATKANEDGLLGFGSTTDNSYHAEFEGSAAVLLRPDVAVGGEYKHMPNNGGALGGTSAALQLGNNGTTSNSWSDIFVAYFPNKSLSITAAYAMLGNVATVPNQSGPYLSLQASF